MELDLLLDNLTNPALLFFFLGILAVQLKSDLQIPENSSKFISLYLLFSIGFKGGQELAHSDWGGEIYWSMVLGLIFSILVPLYTYFILRKRTGSANAGAIAASYGSVSAVTFVTSISFLEINHEAYGGHMVAVMALMEAPAIIMGILLLNSMKGTEKTEVSMPKLVGHSLTNGSVLLILGSLVIGFMATPEQAQGIKPFTTDLFKGFLAIFLLDMGITSGRKLKTLTEFGAFPFLFAVVIPVINGILTVMVSGLFLESAGNRFLLAILVASASYIAVPAAMKIAVPKANPGLFIPMALAITFPFNITLGMPIYWYLTTLT
ncbi:sodium-dependent bicarbonate transport family permease [Pontibacter sp. G13]|uniref:sodium-dependent bicarbonate transport family permease n=1 Tax=Pontibacter sp. G13 TaxID=3074898 RepID=UPI0028890AB2|nr:sodium-dependent bicarbonate transport family permease [Pontibacter sp. G13]WNJ18289.1 sodium-dependent bicarbonate transport family permease [Pontibacter sp. G13]